MENNRQQKQTVNRNVSTAIWFTILITLIFFLSLGIVSIWAGILFADDLKQYRFERYYWVNAAAQFILSGMIVLVSWKIGIFDRQEYAGKPIGRGLFIGLVGVVYALFQLGVNLIGNIAYIQIPSFSYLLSGIFGAFTTGLYEEVLVRGFVYNNFKRHFGNSLENIKKSIIWSSILFGAMHVVNLKGYDLASILTTLAQMIYAAILGMYFALVYMKSKSMWAVVIIHAMIDGSTFVVPSMLSADAFVQTGGQLPSTGQIVLLSFVLPLAFMLPFVIAIIVKWRKLDYCSV